MEMEIVETVLTDVLKELKTNNELVHELRERTLSVENRLTDFEKKLEKIQIVVPRIETRGMEELATRYFNDFCKIVENLPKKKVREFRFLFFPETNTDRYYKIIFGRIIPWSYGLFAVLLLIPLGRQYVSTRTEIEERKYYYEIYSRAWQELEDTVDKSVRKKMDIVLKKSADEGQ